MAAENINDAAFAALGVLGHTGSLNDRMLQWGNANHAGTSGHVSDAILAALLNNGGSGNIQDAWRTALLAQGYTGSMADMQLQFWRDGGGVFV